MLQVVLLHRYSAYLLHNPTDVHGHTHSPIHIHTHTHTLTACTSVWQVSACYHPPWEERFWPPPQTAPNTAATSLEWRRSWKSPGLPWTSVTIVFGCCGHSTVGGGGEGGRGGEGARVGEGERRGGRRGGDRRGKRVRRGRERRRGKVTEGNSWIVCFSLLN